MKVKVSSFLIIISLLRCNTFLHAQTIEKDSLVKEQTITVYGNRLQEFDAGVKVLQTDSLTKDQYRHNNLSSLLEQNSTIYIKSYGLGSLSTMSFRGAGASQTSVLWNGFNIQSPMNGVLDLALVPNVLIDQVKLQYGGSGAMWGSGSVSGSVHLDNKPDYNKGWQLRYSSGYGSFQNISQSASVALSKKKYIVSLKGFLNDAINNFSYINTTQLDKPKTRQTNANLHQYGLMMDNYVMLSQRNQLNLRLWQQYSNREIPPSMLVPSSMAFQRDWFVRVSTELQHTRKKSTWNLRFAYFDENLLYRDSSYNINSRSHSICQISEAETKIKILRSGVLNIGINNTYGTAKVDDYVGMPFQNRTALFTNIKYSGKENRWRANIGARKEVVNSSRYEKLLEVPIMPFAGIDVNITKKIMMKSSVTRNYRLPTFNDLYWSPGGNINLQPEQGWSEELGLHFNHKNTENKFFNFSFSSTVFNRNIDNWIMWIPDASYWVPKNVLKVWSRGAETTLDMNLNLGITKINLGGRYDYVLSTTQKVAPGSENELNKQLIYVPLHKGGIKGGITMKGYGLTYMHNFTGWVYTQADNERYLNAFWLGNLIFSKTYFMKSTSVNFLFKINNIWNKEYQVIAYRAMPGQNFEIGISVQYNKKIN